uniref:LysM and putative peptidoglycan-binding domain-containing protein 2 n=1 Tax=Noccaea caerulescens TaxID=107243 RepID=A0A1J3F6Z4_NOCCA
MLTDRGRRISLCNGTLDYSNRKFRGGNGYGFVDRSNGCRDWSPSNPSASRILRISSPNSSPPSSNSSSSVSLNCSYSTSAGYIEHRVSKFDTLAGIAIKYGVEVADITKLNGLVTDLQMFALKSLRIPLPGRHPPSPCLSTDSLNHGEDCPEQQASSSASNGNVQDVFDSFQSLRLKPPETKVSPAMNSLQGYYGLKPKNRRASEGFEGAIYKKESSHLQDNDQYLTPLPATNAPLNHHRKSRSLVDAVIAEVNQSSDLSMRRRQKSEADFKSQTPELLLKEENRSVNGGFSAIAGKGLALRSKAASRTNLSADTETGNSNLVPVNLMDAPAGDSFSSVRKSISASSLQEPDCNSNGLSLWPTSKWTLKPELLTQAAMASSIFDGLPLPLPLNGRRNKKAVD